MSDHLKQLEKNIPKLLAWKGMGMFLVIMPVAVPYYQSHGLDMEEIYILQAIFSISIAILEVPSGYVADLLGRKRTLIVNGIFHGLGFTVLAWSDSFTGFVLFELFLAIAVSLGSGTDVAMLYDTMAALPEEKKTPESEILGKKLFYAQGGETVAALLGGALAVYSLQLPATVNAIFGWVPLLIALTLVEPERQLMDKKRHLDNFRYIFQALFRHSRLLSLIILNLVFYGLATLLAVWAFQGFWKVENVPLHYFGYLWAAYNLMVAITARFAHRLERAFGSVALIVIIGLLPVAGYFGMAYFSIWIAIGFAFAFQICRGLTQVVFRDALNKRVSGDMRATANSVSSLGVRFGFALIGPAVGFAIDHSSYAFTFSLLGGAYILLFLLLCLPLIALRKEFLQS